MRKIVLSILAASCLASGGAWAWARCSAMSGYSRPFNFRPSAQQIALAQEMARQAQLAAKRQKNAENRQKRAGAIKDLEEQTRALTTERRRDSLEDRFLRAYDMGKERREKIAKELYDLGKASEKNKSIEAAKDYYLFAMQIAPGSDWSRKAHDALIRLDETAGKAKGATRGDEAGDTLLSQADVNEIEKETRAAGGDDNDEDEEKVRQMLEQMTDFPDERQQALIIEELRTGPGAAYSNGLVKAIRLANGAAKDTARKALIERFSRMTADTLRGKLKADEDEARLAAIKAIAAKKKDELGPALIEALDDKSDEVRQAARQTLQGLTGQDFGPEPGAATTERFAARQRWQKWWKANK